MLHAAIGCHGSPKAIVTDGGAIFHLRAELARRDYDDQGTPTHDHPAHFETRTRQRSGNSSENPPDSLVALVDHARAERPGLDQV